MTQQKAIYTLTKQERICSKLLIDRLFGGGNSHAMTAFPIRMVYLLEDIQACTDGGKEQREQVQVLFSVPKRYFKRAVKRNLVKRLMREAYRKNKLQLRQLMAGKPQQQLSIAFIWTDTRLQSGNEVEKRMQKLLNRIVEKL